LNIQSEPVRTCSTVSTARAEPLKRFSASRRTLSQLKQAANERRPARSLEIREILWSGRRVRAITFDVGGTLIKPWPSVGHIYSEVAARHGFPGLSVATLNRQFIAAWGAAKEFDYSRLAWAQLVDETFRGLTDKPPSQTFFAKLHSRFAQPEAWRVFEDVVPTLETLTSRGIKLGLISNWDERLRPLLRRLNLHDYFEAIVVSCEVSFAKPSAVIFELAAEKLAVPPEAVLHVGDSPTNNVEGARAAGLEAVQLQRGARGRKSEVRGQRPEVIADLRPPISDLRLPISDLRLLISDF